MLLLVQGMKAMVEVALLATLGYALIGVLAGARRDANPVWRLFDVLIGPPRRLVRWAAPRSFPERHLTKLTFLLLAIAWLALTAAKIWLVLGHR